MKLIVKNFGPIKNVEIKYNQLIIFIGPQASGKSVLSKLLTIFNDSEFIISQDLNKFLAIYNIEFLNSKTYIEYQYDDFFIKFLNFEIKTNFNSEIPSRLDLKEKTDKFWKQINDLSAVLKNTTDDIIKNELINTIQRIKTHLLSIKPIYIPTERLFVASISDFLFNFMKSDINLPECVINFGAMFENARKKIINFKIPLLENVEYLYENSSNKIRLNHKQIINLTQSSSGMQAIIPMILLIEHYSSQSKTSFIIEEPELNLYPITQKNLIEYISSKCLENNHNVIITTHSPYILTSFANLIQAHNVAKISSENETEVNKIISKETWIDFKKVSAYYINNGNATDILDYENKTIDANAIDDVSDLIANEFETLLNLKYKE
jgi:predicted ATPase